VCSDVSFLSLSLSFFAFFFFLFFKIADLVSFVQGEFVDCECVAPLYPRPTRVHPDKIKAIAEFRAYVAGQKPIAGGPAPNCPVKITDIPADVFSNSKDKNMNIHNHFCQGWPVFKDEKKTMTVDSKGANVKPEPQRKVVVNDGIIGKRTPPANPDSFTNYQFELEFLPSGKGGACSMDCNAAFAKMAAGCAGSTRRFFFFLSFFLSLSLCLPFLSFIFSAPFSFLFFSFPFLFFSFLSFPFLSFCFPFCFPSFFYFFI